MSERVSERVSVVLSSTHPALRMNSFSRPHATREMRPVKPVKLRTTASVCSLGSAAMVTRLMAGVEPMNAGGVSE